MPLPSQIPLTLFGPVIKAKDVDLSNKDVSFEIDPSGDFTIEYDSLDADDNLSKTHIASIKTAKLLNFDGGKDYTITVYVS